MQNGGFVKYENGRPKVVDTPKPPTLSVRFSQCHTALVLMKPDVQGGTINRESLTAFYASVVSLIESCGHSHEEIDRAFAKEFAQADKTASV